MYTRCRCSRKPQEYKFSDKELTSFEEKLKLIAVKARIQILLLLSDSPHCVCDITAHTGFSQSLVSHHLADLMEACLVGSKKDGKFVEYFLNENGQELLKAVEHVSMCCKDNECITEISEGGENTMKQDEHGCDCEDMKKKCCGGEEKGCCTEDTKTEDMSKEDLQAKKTRLEESLKEVSEALTKTE
jgi:DNA-binding transcriptional ArsR family regulator